MLTTKQTAQRLGVSVRYVVKLIKAGRLKAEKFGVRVWMVDEDSVEAYVPRPRGRPRDE